MPEIDDIFKVIEQLEMKIEWLNVGRIFLKTRRFMIVMNPDPGRRTCFVLGEQAGQSSKTSWSP
jgi:hypothetical protein